MTTGAVEPPKEAPKPTTEVWAVQAATGGIPEEPILFSDRDTALCTVAELAATLGIDPLEEGTEVSVGPDGGYLGDCNQDDEVRWWLLGLSELEAPDPATMNHPVEYGVVLGYLRSRVAADETPADDPKAVTQG